MTLHSLTSVLPVALVFALGATASAQLVVLGDMDTIANPFLTPAASVATVGNFDADPDNELEVFSPQGPTQSLWLQVPRSGALFNDLRGHSTIEWSFAGGTAGTFLQSVLMINTDVSSTFLRELANSRTQALGNGGYAFDYLSTTNVNIPQLLDNWASGAGTYFMFSIVQHSDGPSTVLYDDFVLTNPTGQPVPEPAAYALVLGLIALAWAASRRRSTAP